jgi:hypothetical protein
MYAKYESKVTETQISNNNCFNTGRSTRSKHFLLHYNEQHKKANYKEQDRQCTYNVKLMRVRTSIVALEKQNYYTPVCVYL